MSRYYDVSVPISAGGLVYPGNPEIRIVPHEAIARGDGANVSSLAFGSHTGTHVDAAKHFVDDGQTVDQIPLERLIGPALLIAFPEHLDSIGAAQLASHPLGGHRRVLLKTRNSGLMSRPSFDRGYTYLAPDGADFLVREGAELVGIDYLSIEEFRSGHHRTHLTLLREQVVIIEGLDLTEPAPGVYELFCLPLKLRGLDGAPARVVLRG